MAERLITDRRVRMRQKNIIEWNNEEVDLVKSKERNMFRVITDVDFFFQITIMWGFCLG